MDTVRVFKLVVFFDDGEVRTLSAPVAAASSLLSPRAFDSLRRLLLDGFVDRLALLGEETVSEITDLCFFKFYLVFEKGFAFGSPCFILLNSFFEDCLASARSLMESFPIICSQLELSQLSLCVIDTSLSIGSTVGSPSDWEDNGESNDEDERAGSMPN